MGITREELTEAGASPDLARLPVRELRQNERQNDLTRNPMAVATVVAFLGVVGRLALGVTSLQTDMARIEAKVDGQAADISEIKTDIADLRTNIDEIKKGQGEIVKLLAVQAASQQE